MERFGFAISDFVQLVPKCTFTKEIQMISQNHLEFLKSLFSQILTLCQIIALKFFRYPPVSSWVSANMEFDRETFEFIIKLQI